METLNDSFFILYTLNEQLTDLDKKIMKETDNAEVTANGFMMTPFGSTYIYNLSTGCKTALNILHHPEILFDTIGCGPNVINILLSLNNISFYMDVPSSIKDFENKEGICFNDKDIIYDWEGYWNWWDKEYKRREEDDL